MKINWGLLSTAHINRRIIPAIEQSGRGRVMAVASRELPKAQAYASQWNIPKAYGSYEDLLADSDIQVVYISLPNHLHCEWIIKSLEAGKHVLCEKPLCLSLAEMTMIEEVCQKTGMYVMEGLMHLYHPQTYLWKTVIDSGVIGEVHMIRSCFSFNFERGTDNYRWNAASGGGALWDVGVYPISLFQYLFEESSRSVFASMYMDNGVDHSTTALLTYEGGRTAQFYVSFRSEFSTDTVVHGSLGQLYISHPYTNVEACQAYIRIGDKIEKLDVPQQYLYNGEVEAMHDLILAGEKPMVSLEFSRSVLETILKLKNE